MSAQEFAETAALLAQLEGDRDRLMEILDGMLPGELATFGNALSDLLDDVLTARRRKVEGGAL